MTKFTSLIPAFLRDRFKSLNRIILLMLIAIVMTEVYVFFQEGTGNLGASLMSYTVLWSWHLSLFSSDCQCLTKTFIKTILSV